MSSQFPHPYGNPEEKAVLTRKIHTPALDLWQKRLLDGVGGQKRDDFGTWKFDALWQAACREAEAIEAYHAGSLTRAALCLDEARCILEDDVYRREVEQHGR